MCIINALTIVTRQSPLALWQAQWVSTQLQLYHPNLTIKLLPIKTSGDKWLQSLQKVGGKGLFVKELEEALLKGEADLAVHSLKDMPAFFPPGLKLAAICERENPLDAWICPAGFTPETIPSGARIGTSSLRRIFQLRCIRPDLIYEPLRGNINTRLARCQAHEFDAIVLAVAGLKRLSLDSLITQVLPLDLMLPAVGQGALAIECREQDAQTQAYLGPLHHQATSYCVQAERAMNTALGGNCHVPIAGFATIEQTTLTLRGRVGHLSGQMIKAQGTAALTQAQSLGEQVAQSLLAQGAGDWL